MDRRLEFNEILVSILGHREVYFQPGENVTIDYSRGAIVYQRDYENSLFADDAPYSSKRRYSVTYIDRNPDNTVIGKLASLPMSVFDRFFKANGLNHDVYKIYY